MARQAESTLSNKIKKWLNANGFKAWKVWQGAYSEGGIADIHGIRDGKYLACETKTKDGATTALQDRFLSDVRERGGYTISPRSLAEVQAFVREHWGDDG